MVGLCGEFPSGQLNRLIESDSYAEKVVTDLKQSKLIRTHYKDGLRGYRLTKRAKELLLSQNPCRFQNYLTGNAETNLIRSELPRRLRLHQKAETYLTLSHAGIPFFPDEKPLLFSESSEAATFPVRSLPLFYSSREIKNFETQLIQKEENHKNIKTEYLALSEEINKVLLENKISDLKYINEIEKSIDKISHMKEEIEKHKNDTVYVLKMILDYKEQLKNRNFSKEKFENLAERDKIVNMCLEKNICLLGEITKSIEIFNINKKRAEEILKEKEKIEKKLNPAKEMTELLKGRKFLDFLSAGKLQSITRIASETLQRITNGRYRINVDEKSDFSIMDNFNSAVRKPQSLSGGETFMVSLCLALALANQIQLKGKSKLEFFFLDEGFGTLDSELLEIVFSVLENLKAEGMTVGIITHVEEIKNRVARKLMVYPAQVGISGTVVKEI